MPIGKEGTENHARFKALYEEFIKPPIEARGYEVKRADDVQHGGNITKDIILPLAEADLVVADLTNLNPNVFYELGVRHSLRGQGTIMFMMEEPNSVIPFDIGHYRVISYRNDISGLGKLRRALEAFVDGSNEADDATRDNPVHDSLPSLPVNAFKAAQGSAEGALREELAKHQRRVREYEKKYGPIDGSGGSSGTSPIDVIASALSEARAGSLVSDLMAQADDALKRRDARAFLEVVARVVQKQTSRPSVDQIVQLVGGAKNLGLEDVAGALLTHAREYYPKERKLRMIQLELFAHSGDPANRERARQELMAEIGVAVSGEGVRVPERMAREHAAELGIMLDTFHRDGMDAQALEILEAVAQKFPDNCIIVRNYGRALERVGRDAEALEWHRKALWCPDVDDTAGNWLGNELHNRQRHVDAVEAYLHECMCDPDDAKGFSNVADEIAFALNAQMAQALGVQKRSLPDGVGIATINEAVRAALLCPMIGSDDLDRCNRALKEQKQVSIYRRF
jgi:tetratricopeptide (TPR) repeat protein